MKLTFDVAPLAFLALGAILLLTAGLFYLLGQGVSTVVVAMGAVFVLVAIATAIAPGG